MGSQYSSKRESFHDAILKKDLKYLKGRNNLIILTIIFLIFSEVALRTLSSKYFCLISQPSSSISVLFSPVTT